MALETSDRQGSVALVTGAARRIGAAIARTLHGAGLNVALHYHRSAAEARRLRDELNRLRAGSAVLLEADLREMTQLDGLIDGALRTWGRLDALVNNASAFFPTAIGSTTPAHWAELMDANLRAPFFLAQAAAPALAARRGCIVNVTDVHAERPLKGYSVYSISKAGLLMMTRSLARELGPEVRVNAVAPGAVLWPEAGLEPQTKSDILSRTALGRQGDPREVAAAVLFLVRDATYTTGQVIAVDGGRSLFS